MKLQHTLTDAQAEALLALEPRALRHGPAALDKAVDALIQAEQQRRGSPDPVSGVATRFALTEGTLLNSEFDPSLHHQEWRIGAVLVDVKGLINHNERLGFARGDQLLARVASTLESTFPGAKVVRIHTDGFAALLGPISGREVQDSDAELARTALTQALAPLSTPPDAPAKPIEFDLGLLELTCVAPAHLQVLGPIVWSEAERALMMAKSGRASGIQRRQVVLDASIPGEPTLAR